MRFHRVGTRPAKTAGAGGMARAIVAAAILIAVVLFTLARAQTAAKAGPPGPLEIVDRALASDIALEDEGQYRLIDPVGPGGLRRVDAIAQVTSPTMQIAPYGGERTPYGQYAPEDTLMMSPPGPNVTRGEYGASVGRHADRGTYPDRDHDHGPGYGGQR